MCLSYGTGKQHITAHTSTGCMLRHWQTTYVGESVEEEGKKASNQLLRRYTEIWKTLNKVNLGGRESPTPFIKSLLVLSASHNSHTF